MDNSSGHGVHRRELLKRATMGAAAFGAGGVMGFGAGLPAAAAAQPAPGPAFFDVRAHGVESGATQSQTDGFQRAVNACHENGGGTVYVPPGEYLSAGIELKSHVTLYLEHGAVVYASTSPEDYSGPRVLVHAGNAEHIGITGPGILHGQATADLGRRPGYTYEPRPSFRTRLVLFEDCRHVSVRDATLLFSDAWAVHFRRCQKVFVDGVSVLNNYFRTNTDGINPDSCNGVHISNCHIIAGDDCICLKTHDGIPCENVVITNCTVESIATAIKLGTQSEGDFRDIVISNCVVRNSTVGLGFFIKDGGTIERVTCSNLIIETLDDPMLVNPERLRNMMFPIYFDVEQRREPSPIGRVRDVILKDIQIYSDNGILIQGMRQSPIENLWMSNILFRVSRGFDYSEREKHAGGDSNPDDDRITLYARQPSYCTLAHITGLTVDNLRVVMDDATYATHPRSALSVHEAQGVMLSGISRAPAGVGTDAPVINLENAQQVLISGGVARAGTPAYLALEGASTADVTLTGNDLRRAADAVRLGGSVSETELRIHP